MSQTVIRGTQILNNTVQRQDLDTSTVGQAVVTKLVQGSGITLSSTGADSGTGDVTVSSPDVVSTDAGNIATLGTDNHILVPQSQIWSVRLRSFNALAAGNPNFEVDQISVGATIAAPAAKNIDRWQFSKGGTMVASLGQNASLVTVPGTNYAISNNFYRATLTTQQASLGASDLWMIFQTVDGPVWRELSSDVHSISLLVRSSVAGLKFGCALRDGGLTRSLAKLCTITNANTWTLITLPNIPVWAAGGSWNPAPGQVGYQIFITLCSGSTLLVPANDTWQNGNFIGAVGQDNFASKPVNSTFDIAFIQHESGSQSSTLMDVPFSQNYDSCLRYFQKTYQYGDKPGTITQTGMRSWIAFSGAVTASGPSSFLKVMAKVPTVTFYNYATGAANSVRDGAGGDHASASAGVAGDSGFAYVQFASAVGSNTQIYAHYTADTGW
jgi:hypothetical protein